MGVDIDRRVWLLREREAQLCCQGFGLVRKKLPVQVIVAHCINRQVDAHLGTGRFGLTTRQLDFQKVELAECRGQHEKQQQQEHDVDQRRQRDRKSIFLANLEFHGAPCSRCCNTSIS